MRKKFLAVAVMCGVFCVSAPARPAHGFSFHAGAGPSVLTGDISDLWNTGLSIRGYGYNRLNSNFLLGLGMDVNWHTMDEAALFYGSVPSGWSASGDLFMIEIGPTLRYQPQSSETKSVRFFGEAAISFYRMGWTTTVDGTWSGYGFNGALSGDKNQLGLTLGGGVAFGRFEITPLLHFPFDDDMYITINGGVAFGK